MEDLLIQEIFDDIHPKVTSKQRLKQLLALICFPKIKPNKRKMGSNNHVKMVTVRSYSDPMHCQIAQEKPSIN